MLLIDSRERFVFMPLLYELVTGEMGIWEVAPPYAELLDDTDCAFLRAEVQRIDLDRRQIVVRQIKGTNSVATTDEKEEQIIDYDRLVIALGSQDTRDLVLGARENALGFRSVEDAIRLRERIRILEASSQSTIRVVIVGGGYSGVELACNLSDRLGTRAQIQIVERGTEIMPNSAPYNRAQARRALRIRNIGFVPETAVVSVGPDSLQLVHRERAADSTVTPTETTLEQVDLVLWTAGTRINAVLRESLSTEQPIERNERGQLRTDRFLRLPTHPEVTVIGDAAQIREPMGAVPVAGPSKASNRGMTAQMALQEADYAAWNLWASLTGRDLLPFQYVHLGEMITLGRDDGSVQLLGLVNLSGPIAHQLRRMAYIARMPTDAHRLRVGASYVAQPLLRILEGMIHVTSDLLDVLGQGRRTRSPGCPFTTSDAESSRGSMRTSPSSSGRSSTS
jgi:NADH dehydrogenase